MYFFTSDTIVKANEYIKSLDPKIGGLLCVLHCLTENIEENISYEINGVELRKQLSTVFDKEPKESFENVKCSYIIFAKDWISTFFEKFIKNRVDLLSCAVFFLRRSGFEKECTKEEIIDIFIKRFNLINLKDHWFCDISKFELEYNQGAVESNQSEFYTKMGYSSDFKSILFSDVIKKSAADLKAAGQIQTLYSGSGVQECFLLSNEPLEKYYIMSNSDSKKSINNDEEIFNHSVYGIHIKLQNNALSEEAPHICIGWSGMGDLSDITTKEELALKYDATWTDVKPKKRGQDIGQVWRFVKEMQIGDYVVFSCGDTCHIGKITSDYYFDNTANENQHPDYTNIRDVEWLKKDIRKSDLSQVLQNSLGAAMSVFGLNDYKSAIQELLNDTYKKDEEDIEIEENNNIFEGFSLWLTSYDNPDYTGREKYAGYPRALERLVQFMKEKGYIDDDNLNDINLEKFNHIKNVYDNTDEVKEFDERFLASKAGIASLKKYIKYIEYLMTATSKTEARAFDYSDIKGKGINKIFYGVPGCGKSYYIEHDILGKDKVTKKYTGDYKKDNIIRTTFYQDYSNTDFVGQILPKIVKGINGEKDTVEYIFNPGPFTLALIRAISNPNEKVALIVEEINRGNAPAIFGDIFQLLDRDDNSISEYGITNVGVLDYLNSFEFDVEGEKKRYTFGEIKIPGNMDIFATMNTSDQNVYTLDTAFTRRWSKERMPNDFNGNEIKDMLVPGMYKYTWEEFVGSVNKQIQDKLDDLQVNEDKQVGAFFVKKSDLLPKDASSDDKEKAKSFAYKVLEYLWDDVSKLDHTVIFNPSYKTFESLVEAYLKNGVTVFNREIFKEKTEDSTLESSLEE